MSAWVAALHPGVAGWVGALLRASEEGGLAIAVIWALCRLLPRLSGRTQCWLWRLAYLKLLVSLIGVAPLSLPLLPAPPSPRPVAPPRPDLARASDSSMEPGRILGLPSAGYPRSGRMLLLLWLLGAGAGGMQLLSEWHRTRRLRMGGEAVRDETLIAACWELCGRLGIDRGPELRTAVPLTCPVLVGVARPAILLPASFPARFAPAELRLMLAHELAHVKRRDLLWAWLPNLGRLLFFFHPLVWLAEGEWRLAQEMACDEAVVLSTGASHARYGAMLLEVMGQPLRSVPAGRLAAGIAESYATVKRRLVAIRRVRVSSPPGRAGGAVSRSLAALFLAIAGAAGIVPWRLTSRTAAPVVPHPAVADRSPLRRLPDLTARAGDAIRITERRQPERQRISALPSGPIPSVDGPVLGTDSGRVRTNVAATNEHQSSLAAPASGRSDIGRLKAGWDLRMAERPFAADKRQGDPIGSVQQDAMSPDDPPAPLDPGKDAASREGDRPEGKPFAALIMGKESADKDSLRLSPRRLGIEKQIILKKQLGRDPEMGQSGFLRMPKPFANPSARIGWRPFPLLGERKRVEVVIDRGLDPRLFTKLMSAAKEDGIDPAQFKQMVALASLDGAFDPRVLKKLLGQTREVTSGKQPLPEAKWRLPTEKELWREKQLDDLKRRAEEEAEATKRGETLDTETKPDP